jgi:hypothetical protein
MMVLMMAFRNEGIIPMKGKVRELFGTGTGKPKDSTEVPDTSARLSRKGGVS